MRRGDRDAGSRGRRLLRLTPAILAAKTRELDMETPELESLRDIARRLSGPLRRHLQRRVGDEALADDLLQETLIRVSRGLPSFDGRSSVKTWVFAIATHVAADHFRSAGRAAQASDVDDSELVDPAPSVDERLIIDEMNACVRQIVAGLPADYRTAVVLHDLEGSSAQETADRCGCSVATAKIRIHRGRTRLKAALEQQCSFHRDDDMVLRCSRRD
jgi:RNA polymerase sigma-70 factor (ECF subfamily)